MNSLTEGEVGARAFLACEPEDMGIQSVFLQTGYLTIKSCHDGLYQLDFPNFEVKKSFYDSVAERYSYLDAGKEQSYIAQLIQQILDNQYPQKYQMKDKRMVLIGVEFDKAGRNISGYLVKAPNIPLT